MLSIDLNADLGEGFGRWTLGDDEALLGVVTSANVACGFHAGDPAVMERTCVMAVTRGVAIGAQVGYRDLHGFGRRFLDIHPDELRAEVVYQVGALEAFARHAGGGVRYVKPHGALYHATVGHEDQARAVVAAVVACATAYGRDLTLLGPPGSALLRLAREAGLPVVQEGFADRGYRADGTLVPRGEPGAVVTDPTEVARRAVAMARGEGVVTEEGTVVHLEVQSLCLHGDTPGAVELAAAVRCALEDARVRLASFTR